MKIAPNFRIAIRALRRNKTRSLLTILGIIVGVGAVLATVAIGNGARLKVESQIAAIGRNIIVIFSGGTSSSGVKTGWGGPTIKVEDALAIAREVPGVTGASPEVLTGVQVAAGNQNWFTYLLGESPEYIEMRQWEFSSGGPFTDQEVRAASKVALIGQTAAGKLFGTADPVGQVIRVRNVPFLVTGLLRAKGVSFDGSDQDDIIIVPYTTAMKRLTGETRPRLIVVGVDSLEAMPRIKQEIAALLRQRHGIGPGREDDFTVLSQTEIAEMATATSKVLTTLLASIACVSLVVGGIGIMNIMLVSVTERTREIGIRMAVGAHGPDILLQFLVEAVMLSALGGMLGIGLGIGFARVVSRVAGWPTSVPVTAVVVTFVFSGAIGVFFGLYPARKAASLDPIEALRYE